MRHRHITRRHVRTLSRRPVRRSVRIRWRSPNYLSQVLVAFNRVLRCRRQLAKLAPDFFDTVVVDRAARERDERRRWRAEWEPALNKVYGLPSTPEPDPDDAPPPLPSPRIQRRVDALLAECNRELAAGRLALRHFHERRPQTVASLSQIARLLWAAVQFGRSAAGMPDHPEPPSPPPSDPWADLARAYPASDPRPTTPSSSDEQGGPVPVASPSPSDAERPANSRPEACARSSRREKAPSGISEPEPEPSPVNSGAMSGKVETPPSVPAGSPPEPVRIGRRDAWGSLARQLRRNAGLH